jgi:hypothetical protein
MEQKPDPVLGPHDSLCPRAAKWLDVWHHGGFVSYSLVRCDCALITRARIDVARRA